MNYSCLDILCAEMAIDHFWLVFVNVSSTYFNHNRQCFCSNCACWKMWLLPWSCKKCCKNIRNTWNLCWRNAIVRHIASKINKQVKFISTVSISNKTSIKVVLLSKSSLRNKICKIQLVKSAIHIRFSNLIVHWWWQWRIIVLKEEPIISSGYVAGKCKALLFIGMKFFERE